jgi:hypothetical protein
MSVKDRDDGYKHIMAQLAGMESRTVTVGIQAASGEDMVKVAATHEFGAKMIITRKQAYFMAINLMGLDPKHAHGVAKKLTGKQLIIPERSWLRGTYDEKRAAIEKAAAQVLDRIAAGQSVDQALAWFGQGVVTLIQRRIRSGIGPDNAPLTQALKKGQNTPLINHGRFVNSIRYEVKGGAARAAE